jgi:predicted transcriptional regulator
MSIRIEASAKERLKEIAKRQKRTAHALATEAINTLIEQKEREYAFNQSCIDSYNQFKETGLHVNHEEVTAWMNSWGTDNELPHQYATNNLYGDRISRFSALTEFFENQIIGVRVRLILAHFKNLSDKKT